MTKTMIFLIFVLFIGTIVSTNGCTVHRLDIQQGNIIKDEMIDQLKVGSSKRQVKFVMGSPLLTDPFHPERWDYVFTDQPGNKREITDYRHVSVYFKDDKLVKVVK